MSRRRCESKFILFSLTKDDDVKNRARFACISVKQIVFYVIILRTDWSTILLFYVKVHALSMVALANLLTYSSLYQSQQTWPADQSEQSRLMEGRGLQSLSSELLRTNHFEIIDKWLEY